MATAKTASLKASILLVSFSDTGLSKCALQTALLRQFSLLANYVAPLRKMALYTARRHATPVVAVSSNERIRRNVMHVISGPWWSWVLRGIAAIAFGVLAILWPDI